MQRVNPSGLCTRTAIAKEKGRRDTRLAIAGTPPPLLDIYPALGRTLGPTALRSVDRGAVSFFRVSGPVGENQKKLVGSPAMWTPPWLTARSLGAAYWDEVSPRIVDYWKRRNAAEIEALHSMPYPQEGTFDGEPVSILGPITRFPPYNTHPARGSGKTTQMMVTGGRGRFVAMAKSLVVDGKPLLTRPPYKHRDDSPLIRAMRQGERQQRRAQWEAGLIPPKRRTRRR